MIFNAHQFAPNQGMTAHPVGQGFDAVITDTKVVPTGVTQDNPQGTGKSFNVEFTTPLGKLINRYNMWNNNAKTVEISVGQLSALCHVTGVMQIDLSDQAIAAGIAGAALRNQRCKIDVVHQLDADKKPTQYTQLSRVLDTAGHEPGKAPAGQVAQQQPQTVQQPIQQPNPNPAPNAWANPPQSPQQPQQPTQWQPGNNGNAAQTPPWSQNK